MIKLSKVPTKVLSDADNLTDFEGQRMATVLARHIPGDPYKEAVPQKKFLQVDEDGDVSWSVNESESLTPGINLSINGDVIDLKNVDCSADDNCIALGNKSEAYGNSFCYGVGDTNANRQNIASGSYCINFGWHSSAIGNYSTVLGGQQCLASGAFDNDDIQYWGPVAQGVSTSAISQYCHAEGSQCLASGPCSHAEGQRTSAMGKYSHTEGLSAYTLTSNAHAEGQRTSAVGVSTHAEGDLTVASGNCSHAEGNATYSIGSRSHSEGSGTSALGICSHSEGRSTIASGDYSHTEGEFTSALDGGHAEGSQTYAEYGGHAEGCITSAYNMYSHTEGYGTLSYGSYGHAEGYSSSANGDYSHAEGWLTYTTDECSHAEGANTSALGSYAHAEGSYTVAKYATHAEGKYNEYNNVPSNTLLMIGNGTSENNRSNIMLVTTSSVSATKFVNADGTIPSIIPTAAQPSNTTAVTFYVDANGKLYYKTN